MEYRIGDEGLKCDNGFYKSKKMIGNENPVEFVEGHVVTIMVRV